MPETNEPKELEDLQDDLREVQDLLRRHRVVEGLVEREQCAAGAGAVAGAQAAQRRAARQAGQMHPADIAFILEALPRDERLVVWDLVKAERDGEILLEVSEPVRESLIETHGRAASWWRRSRQLDADEIADLAPDPADDVIDDVLQRCPSDEREQLRAAMSYPEDSVGALHGLRRGVVREDVTLEVVLRYLRRFDELPNHTDQVFVVDRNERAQGRRCRSSSCWSPSRKRRSPRS